MIRKNLTKTGLCKVKMNKKSIEILRNIELICFIKKENIKKYKEIILKKLKGKAKLDSFVKYPI